MVKLRDARYCNIKLILLYLVVYGHWIESRIWTDAGLRMQYRFIYLVHMPLFAFLSGLFLRNQKDCGRQIRKLLPVYLVCQVAGVILGSGQVSLPTPWWHLWYLLSCCFWAGAAWLWFRFAGGRGRILILLFSVLIGCGAGNIPWLDRTLSGSRTVVFFPYFWLGVILKPDIPWEKYRGWSVLGLGILALAYEWLRRIPVTFLYHAAPFAAVEHGEALRLVCYGAGVLLGLGILAWAPWRRLPFSRAGADTMGLYLLHAPIVAILRQRQVHWGAVAVGSAVLIWVIYHILQWNSNVYGIVQQERRDAPWRNLKRSTKNMPGESTGSCCH